MGIPTFIALLKIYKGIPKGFMVFSNYTFVYIPLIAFMSIFVSSVCIS